MDRMTPDHRAALLRLLAIHSFRLGQFTLSSGARSDYYIDCRTTTLHAQGGRLAGLVMLDMIRQNGLAAEAIGGLTMGADPLVCNVASASAWAQLNGGSDPLVHGFLVRKAEKTHGTGRKIEGFNQAGAKVVIVDDVCTTGGSTITAMEYAREAGMIVTGVLCLVEREEHNGRPAVETAAGPGVPFLSVFTASDVRADHIAEMNESETVN
jgi:orotate phosphoribosyltransferase